MKIINGGFKKMTIFFSEMHKTSNKSSGVNLMLKGRKKGVW